ncbi:DoxX family protein [Nocardia brasiliensis]|uniref:DoxX family protein n=1 Tax=Nocardia brasiliensis TaxID=37326 RepID=UPI001E53F015|nr:DoxX family protein [Nocardia brasiliensis]
MSSTATPSRASAAVEGGVSSGHAATPHAYDAGLLLLRIAVGLTMAAHGAQKLFGWFGGGGLDGTGKFFSSKGYPAGEAMAFVAGVTETFGGLALAVGLLTPLAGAAVVGTLLNAIAVKGAGAFFAPKGIEYELILTAAAAALTLTGPGRYALDRFIPVLRNHRLVYGLAAIVLALLAAGAVLVVRT